MEKISMKVLRGVAIALTGCLLLRWCGGCASIRVTQPYRTATEQFLQSESIRSAVQQIAVDELRDRTVYVDTDYISTAKEYKPENVPELLFMVSELRAKLLNNGVRLVDNREDCQIVLEVRTGGIGVDEEDYLFGLPGTTVETATVAAIPITTPELAILKSTKQFGFASVAYVAYWRDTGEVVASSGPFVGRRQRLDYWFLGFGPRTVGDIPPARPAGPGEEAK
jgi:hypothetical protein